MTKPHVQSEGHRPIRHLQSLRLSAPWSLVIGGSLDIPPDPAPTATEKGPAAVYRQRLAELRAEETALDRQRAWSGNGRFALLLALAPLVVVFAQFRAISPYWLALPAAGFIALSVVFARASQRLAAVRRAAAFYDFGLAKLEDRWAGRGVPGTEYLDPAHPCAADLDLFGPGSVFELLCAARTRDGRGRLARWLLDPAPPDEVRRRQEAVDDLRDRMTWRERLALAADDVPAGLDTEALAAWGEAGAGPPTTGARGAALAVVGVSWTAVAAWSFDWLPPSVPALAFLVQIVFALALAPRVRRALDGLHGRSRDLFHLAGLLQCVETEPFTAPRLRELQAALKTEGVPPSERLSELAAVLHRHDSTHNQFVGLFGPLILWNTRAALAAEAWRRATGPALRRWGEVVGEVEALASLAGYAYENPGDPFPELVPDGLLYEAEGLAHPLLPRARCVPNDVTLNADVRLLVVSGSNMSGKSTLLRAVGVNAVLAQAGAPVRATRLRLSPLVVGATLRIQDSLQSGRSRFFAEITRLQQIVTLTEGPRPVLYLLDELLAGTNSHDRRLGAAAVLRALVQRPALGLVTTHDLALTAIAGELAPHAANVHFSDEFVNGELHFDYRLRPGVVQHSNALALMRAVGLKVDDHTAG